MSYEHKETAKNALSMVSSLVGIPREETKIGLEELDHVYAQAAKASEYEAKAAAFDEIMFTVKNVKRDTPFNTTVRNIVRQYEKEYESGEYDD